MTSVITSAGRSAEPANTPGIRPGAPDPIQLYADAHNALEMALHYLRMSQVNAPGAARKAVQALAALRGLGGGDIALPSQGAGTKPGPAMPPATAIPLDAFANWLEERQNGDLQAMRASGGDTFAGHCESFSDVACSLRVLGQFEREQIGSATLRTSVSGRA